MSKRLPYWVAILLVVLGASFVGADDPPTSPSNCYNFTSTSCCIIAGQPAVTKCELYDPLGGTTHKWNCTNIPGDIDDPTLLFLPASSGWTYPALVVAEQTFCSFLKAYCSPTIPGACFFDPPDSPTVVMCHSVVNPLPGTIGPQNCP